MYAWRKAIVPRGKVWEAVSWCALIAGGLASLIVLQSFGEWWYGKLQDLIGETPEGTRVRIPVWVLLIPAITGALLARWICNEVWVSSRLGWDLTKYLNEIEEFGGMMIGALVTVLPLIILAKDLPWLISVTAGALMFVGWKFLVWSRVSAAIQRRLARFDLRRSPVPPHPPPRFGR